MKRSPARHRWAAFVMAFASAIAACAAARAEGARFAVLIGDNEGDRGELVLRYAESDTRRVAAVLRAVGGFLPENITVLPAVGADDVRRALIALNARVRQVGGAGSMLFVFYSGHADADALHLRGTRLGLQELRDLVAGSSADARVLVVDSCRSGALTRVKGGHPTPPFQIAAEAPSPAQGLAILTSSAAGEDSQESDQLGASIFTHHLLSALMGAADRDGDGRVTIDEAFTYASERTLAATAVTLPGPQHPTYRLELGGRNDLTLSEPRAHQRELGLLAFSRAGSYVVQRDGPNGHIVAELTSDRAGGQLAIEAGRYLVTQRNPDHLRQATYTVAAGGATTIATDDMRRVDYARVVRKGATDVASRAVSGFALVGGRSGLLDLGPSLRADLGARLDLEPLSLELRLGVGAANQSNNQLAVRSYETSLAVAGLHVFDLSGWSAGLGLEVGASWLAQRFDSGQTRPRDAVAGLLGPVAQIEVPLGRRSYLRADAAFLTYFVGAQDRAGVSALPSYRLSMGGGMYY
jgi:hypothetical protein